MNGFLWFLVLGRFVLSFKLCIAWRRMNAYVGSGDGVCVCVRSVVTRSLILLNVCCCCTKPLENRSTAGV